MALFMSRGFAAWRHAWTQTAPVHEQDLRCSIRSHTSQEAIRLPDELQSHIVSALAGMVLDALSREAA
jgi:hypothetical protein